MFACALYASAWAVMASPEPFEYVKADGTKVMARIYGDEFHSFIQSLDGELLEGSVEPEVIEQAAQVRRAHRIQQAAGNSAFPTTGSPKSLVLLVGFSDLDFDQTRQDFQDLLTKSGYNYNGATGSCRDYYIASSDSLFQPQFDCYGPYKLSQKMAYYGGNAGKSNSVHAAQMVSEACQMAHEDGVNFKDYDVNNDGLLDNVFIFFAGHNEAEGAGANTIWPHASNISYLNVRLDGVLVGSYACTSEYKGSAGYSRCGIGTFCHEFGHVIGQPDFYDTDYNYYTVGNWDIMCQGSYNNYGNTPPTFSAYERMYEGWLTPKQLQLPGTYTLQAVPFQKEAYLIAASTHNLSGQNPNPKEFFLLEYRSQNDVWDRYLPGHGMLVWHIDYSASAWTNNTPNNGPTLMRMHLEEANGITWQKRSNNEGGRSSDPYPGTQNILAFTPTLHNGTQLEQPIFNITEAGGVVGFTYISAGGATLKANTRSMEITTTMDDKKAVVDWEPQVFELVGSGLDPEQPISIKTGDNTFKLFVGEPYPGANNTAWKTSLELYPNADSTIQEQVWVNFRPVRKNCTPTQSNVSINSPAASISIALTGYSPRATYVNTIEVLGTKDITPYSFAANWKAQEDAEQYYLTVYQKEEGETEYAQDFENFNDMDAIRSAGWQSTTTLTTTSTKADGARSLYIKNQGDQVTTETYPVPISRISFWYNAFTTTADTIGILAIEGMTGDEWKIIEQIYVRNTAKRVTANYEFDEEARYQAFRFTWVDKGGAGIAFDAFKAVTNQKINYLYKGRELSIAPSAGEKTISYSVNGLTPDNTYYYQVQCTDLDKGCEEHLTELSDPIEIKTLAGKPVDSKQMTLAIDSINYSPAQHAIYLTEAKEGDYLYFYNTAGRLVYSTPVAENVLIYPLDLNLFVRGEVYMIQHAKNGKLGRKNKWLKFVY